MERFAYHNFLEINISGLIWVFYFFLSVMVLVFIFILIFSFYKRRKEKKEKLWQDEVADVISHAIFFEGDQETSVEITVADERLNRNYKFRQYLTNEIIHAKKNLSGAPVLNLIKLYESLQLDKDSLSKIKNKKWHIKAKGIQELAIMEQARYVKEIFRLTNDPNELVRNEAQCALVNFYGFKGFRFLNVIIHPISQWQQMQLLNYLHDLQSYDADQLKKWLNSKNNSVITIGLRLSCLFKCGEVYSEVIHCLKNADQSVRSNALAYLQKISEEGTAEEIVKCFSSADRSNKLFILSILQEIGNENQIVFLMKQLHNADDTIKLAAAKTLSVLHPLGTAFFQIHLFADEFPWNAIFKQIENEQAA